MIHENKNRLADLYFQEGSAREIRQTQRHLRTCPDCQESLRTLARTEQMLKTWPDESPAPGTFDLILAKLPYTRPRFQPEPKPHSLLPLAGIAGGIAFILLVLRIGRSVLEQFSFWERLREGWLARTFGDFGFSLILFFVLSGLAALSIAPYLFDYAKKSNPVILKKRVSLGGNHGT